jgi:CheY-like chemotaxis protein
LEILLVEDNPGDIRLVQEGLSASSVAYSIRVARDGEEALAILQRSGGDTGPPLPDLILLDLNLPKKNGMEVLAHVKAQEPLKSIPVIVLTASQNEEDLSRAYALHANCYVTKPLGLDELLESMRILAEFWFSVAKLPRG